MLRRSLFGLALLGLASASGALAAEYPSRPITLVVPFAAGGPTDALARVLAVPLAASLGQAIVVKNVTGAAGSVAAQEVARAKPDGYTLVLGYWGTHVLNGAVYLLSYDVLRDFAPVALLLRNPQIIVARAGMPAADLRELVEWLKKHPNTATQGTAGPGSPAHVGGAFFQLSTGTQFQFIPYRGAAPAMQDLIAGRIDLMFDQVGNALPHIRNGQIRAYAVAADARLAAAPEIPTVDEAGISGFYISVWHGLWAPRDTPKQVIARLNAAAVAALADPATRERLADLGQEIPPPAEQTPEALGAWQKAEIDKWWPIIKTVGIKAE